MDNTAANYLWTFFLSAIPVSEIRGSMIYAFANTDGSFAHILISYIISFCPYRL